MVAPMDVTDDPEATLSVEDAIQSLYLRVALVGQRLNPKNPSYFHLVKAGERLARAWQCAMAERAGRN